MKVIKFNKDNVTEEEVEKRVKKTRGIILNKDGKALIVKYAGLYMFPGGRVQNEGKREALHRELKEESGIDDIEFEDEPFLKVESYDRNYYTRELDKPITRLTETYFYLGNTNEDIDLEKQELSKGEKQQEFEISFKNLSIIRYLAETNDTDNKKVTNFNRELFTAMNEFANYQREKEEQKEI